MVWNMDKWVKDILSAPEKKPLPVLSFPSIQLLNVTVKELINNSDIYAKGMKAVADRHDSLAAVSLMDLSLEAECFGSPIKVFEGEVPTVTAAIVSTESEADALAIPAVGSGRTGISIDAIRKASEIITDRPVLAGVIGPFSLAGRLLDVSEALILCFDEPELVHKVLQKATKFIIDYSNAFKEAGANGIVLAEPLAGLLSPKFAAEFSAPYCKKIVDAVQDENFVVVYHNCGDGALRMMDSILSTGARVLHLGNAIEMEKALEIIPSDIIAMGNIDPASVIKNGNPETVRNATLEVMQKCCKYPNFVVSTGCDVPPLAPWQNIDAFFEAAEEYYRR